ncbi:hypothetical protein [Terribacillus saccharophilus]|uniref:hypothetical protein n=1 Tax=Terribacillus saccharophilus TaxID=361277 RepID=UPI003D2E2A2C
MSDNDDKFRESFSKLIRDHAFSFFSWVFGILIVLVPSAIGAGFAINEKLTENNTAKVESLQAENTKLNEEIGKYKDVNNKSIYKTDSPLTTDQAATILDGEVTILVWSLSSYEVTFEFSFAGESSLSMDERYKNGDLTNRVEFEHEGKSYFIVVDDFDEEEVSFTVYEKE